MGEQVYNAYAAGQRARANGVGIHNNPHFDEDGNVPEDARRDYEDWKAGWKSGQSVTR